MSTFGFIGTGNMGGALAKAVCKAVSPSLVFLSNRTKEKALSLCEELGANITDNTSIIDCDFIFLGVKPNMIKGVIDEIKEKLISRERPAVLISMAASLELNTIREYVGKDYPIIRIMPNTPVAVGEGVVLYCVNEFVSEAETKEFVNALNAAGKCIEIDEKLIDAGSALSGCGPAFVHIFMESLADGAVACGLPRSTAIELAARTVLGSAKLLIESGKNPGQLKDEVCSPGGTTIQGVRTLEEAGFRGAAMDAVISAYEKTVSLKKKN